MSGIPWETVTLTTLSRDRSVFPQLLSEARDMAMRGHEGKLVIHTPWGIEWKPFGLPRRKRPLRSVVLEEGIGAKIQEDIKAFLNRRQWYADRGVSFFRPFQRPSFIEMLYRYPIPPRIPSLRTSRIRKIIFHPGSCRIAQL